MLAENIMMTAAYSSTLISIRVPTDPSGLCGRERARTLGGHSRYHQNWNSVEYLPEARRLELQNAVPAGVCGMRWLMGQLVETNLLQNAILMRSSSMCKVVLM